MTTEHPLGKSLFRCKPVPTFQFFVSVQGLVPTVIFALLGLPMISMIITVGINVLAEKAGIAAASGTTTAKIVLLGSWAVLFAILFYFCYLWPAGDYIDVFERGFVARVFGFKRTVRFDDIQRVTFGIELFGKALGDENEAIIFLRPTYTREPPNAAHAAINFHRRSGGKITIKNFFQRFNRVDLRKLIELIDKTCPGTLPAGYVNPTKQQPPPDWSAVAGRFPQ
jgi:hypothetical protein